MVGIIPDIRPFFEIQSIWKGLEWGIKDENQLDIYYNCREKYSHEKVKKIGRFLTPAYW